MSDTNEPPGEYEYQSLLDPKASKQPRARTAVRDSVMLKVIVVVVLALLLLIPATMIRNLVQERQQRRNDARNEVAGKWGGEQTIGGPVLTLPYVSSDTNLIRYAHFLPTELAIDGDLTPEMRHRGIFDVVLYNVRTHLTGTFARPEVEKLGIRKEQVRWNEAYISIGIPDMHGIRDSIVLNWKGTTIPFTPGIDDADLYHSGAQASLAQMNFENWDGPVQFALDLNLNGSSAFRALPLAKTTTMTLRSAWGKPSFYGNFLPETHSISTGGFSAKWKVLDFNRNVQSEWLGGARDPEEAAFGVQLQTPVDNYQESDRATKYAAMFIGLTFLTFFLIEILGRIKLHPVQYLLVGFALVLFYQLLLSLSEQMRFGYAYFIAGAAVVVLATLYVRAIFKRWKMTLLVSTVVAGLYAYLYVLLRLEDWSLIVGSIGLFVILATVMYLTRKIDWYALSSGGQAEEAVAT